MQRIVIPRANAEEIDAINALLAEGWEVVGTPQAVALPQPIGPQPMSAALKSSLPFCLVVILEKYDDPPPETRRDKWDSEQ